MSENDKKNLNVFDVCVEKKKSKKEGKYYHVLTIKFDYGTEVVSFDLDLIGRLADMSVPQLQRMDVDNPKKIADFVR